MRRFGGLFRRFYSSKPPLEEAEIVSSKAAGEKAAPNPFSESLLERLSPHTSQVLNMVVATLMLSMGLKMMRERGENIEKDKQYARRVSEVTLEIEALEEELPGIVMKEVTQTMGQQIKGQDKLEAAIKRGIVQGMQKAKEAAKSKFEAKLWTPQEHDNSSQPKQEGQAAKMF